MSPIPLKCLDCDEQFVVSTRALAKTEEALACPRCGSPRVQVDMLYPPMHRVARYAGEEYEDEPDDDEPETDDDRDLRARTA